MILLESTCFLKWKGIHQLKFTFWGCHYLNQCWKEGSGKEKKERKKRKRKEREKSKKKKEKARKTKRD